jgi:hypothetical protein
MEHVLLVTEFHTRISKPYQSVVLVSMKRQMNCFLVGTIYEVQLPALNLLLFRGLMILALALDALKGKALTFEINN